MATATTQGDDDLPPIGRSSDEKIKLRNAPASYKSEVWKHFGFRDGTNNNEKTVCKLCYTEVSYKGGNTTNMATHLKRKHSDETAQTAVKTNQTIKQYKHPSSVLAGQMKISESMYAKLGHNSQRAKNITQSIAGFLCKDMRPFSVVENGGFRNLIQTLEPRYVLPSRTHFAEKVLPGLLRNVQTRVCTELNKNADYVAVTTDGWTSRATESFITITAHFIDVEWEYCNYVLQTRPLHDSHTGENLAQVLTGAIDSWGLKKNNQLPAITTDNASNITCGVKEAHLFPHVKCFAHTVNLATQRGLQLPQLDRLLGRVRRIVTFFHKSTTATAILKSKQKLLEIPQNKLIMDVSTRWNSTYDMLSRYLLLQPAIYAALMAKEVKKNVKDIITLSPEDVKDMEDVVHVLEPLKTVTTLMCDTKHPTVSMIYPFKEMLLQKLQVTEVDSSLIKAVKTKISADLQPRYTDDDDISMFLLESCFVDPRFKTLPYTDESKTNDVVSSLKMKCLLFDRIVSVAVKQEPGQPTTDDLDQPVLPSLPSLPNDQDGMHVDANDDGNDAADVPPVKRCKIDSLFADVLVTKVESPKSALELFCEELEQYKAEKPIPVHDDPLAWWKTHHCQFPILARMAKYYLGIPATSVPSERVFSTAGEIVSAQRACLSGENIDMLIFLKSNMVLPTDLMV